MYREFSLENSEQDKKQHIVNKIEQNRFGSVTKVVLTVSYLMI
jgi:hypothetical protein